METNNLTISTLTEMQVQAVYELEQSLLGSGNLEDIKNTIHDEHLKYYVLSNQGEVIGFLQGKIVVDEAELYDICIRQDCQGKGYSKILMENFIEVATKGGCNTIFLEVNTMNYKAISLYQKYGFSAYGTRKNYYGNSDAILMKKVLN